MFQPHQMALLATEGFINLQHDVFFYTFMTSYKQDGGHSLLFQSGFLSGKDQGTSWVV